MPLLCDATDFSSWLLFGYLLSYPSSTSVQLDHLILTCQKAGRRWKNSKKNGKNVRWSTIGRHTCPGASTSGFPDSPWPPPSVDALGYVPAHQQGQQNDLQVWYFFFFFLAFEPAVHPGRYGSNTWPMAASSGFAWSPEPLTTSIGRCRRCRASTSRLLFTSVKLVLLLFFFYCPGTGGFDFLVWSKK